MRYNNSAFDRCLALDGDLTYFYHYTGTIPTYDGTLNVATMSGTITSEVADIQDFSLYEIKNAGGIVDTESKKYIVSIESDLDKGDEILDSTMKQIYSIVATQIFKNRKFLFANKVKDSANQH